MICQLFERIEQIVIPDLGLKVKMKLTIRSIHLVNSVTCLVLVSQVSFQRRNFLEFLPRACPIPIGEKLLLMKRRPFDHKTRYARW